MSYDLPSVHLLHKILKYSAATGSLTWRNRPQLSMFADYPDPKDRQDWWNKNKAGKPALCISSSGYKSGRLLIHPTKDPSYLAHRVIWAMQTGDWPDPSETVKHIDGNRKNNKWINLKIVDGGEK